MKDLISVSVFAVGLTLGYLTGSLGHGVEVPMIPVNYDPARAAYDDALRQAHAATESCWKLTVAKLESSKQVPTVMTPVPKVTH